MCNAPINVKPHSPQVGRNTGRGGGFDERSSPRGGDFARIRKLKRSVCKRISGYVRHVVPKVCCFKMDEISVLVCYGERKRPLKTSSSFLALKEAVLAEFTDIFPVERDRCELLFQRKDDSWGGVFVDIVEEEPIPDRSVVKVSVLYSQHITEDTSSSQQPTEQVCRPLTYCYEKKPS